MAETIFWTTRHFASLFGCVRSEGEDSDDNDNSNSYSSEDITQPSQNDNSNTYSSEDTTQPITQKESRVAKAIEELKSKVDTTQVIQECRVRMHQQRKTTEAELRMDKAINELKDKIDTTIQIQEHRQRVQHLQKEERDIQQKCCLGMITEHNMPPFCCLYYRFK
jgi:hypothetical protein